MGLGRPGERLPDLPEPGRPHRPLRPRRGHAARGREVGSNMNEADVKSADAKDAGHGFVRRGGVLLCDGLSLEEAAKEFGTPLYVYSRAALEAAYGAYDHAFAAVPHRI